MPKLTRKLSFKQFVLSHIAILILSLIFLGGLYYILNIQYQKSQKPYSSLGGPVTSLPKSLRIDLDQPDDDLLIYSQSIIVSGKTLPNTEVLIFTDASDLVIRSDANGNFSTILKLDEGVNRITAVVFDVRGDSRSTERTVYYSKEKI